MHNFELMCIHYACFVKIQISTIILETVFFNHVILSKQEVQASISHHLGLCSTSAQCRVYGMADKKYLIEKVSCCLIIIHKLLSTFHLHFMKLVPLRILNKYIMRTQDGPSEREFPYYCLCWLQFVVLMVHTAPYWAISNYNKHYFWSTVVARLG